jgi:hypothetical protein
MNGTFPGPSDVLELADIGDKRRIDLWTLIRTVENNQPIRRPKLTAQRVKQSRNFAGTVWCGDKDSNTQRMLCAGTL